MLQSKHYMIPGFKLLGIFFWITTETHVQVSGLGSASPTKDFSLKDAQ